MFGLTDREQQVISIVARGESNKVIAHEIGISESTVKIYLRSVLRKMEVTNRTQAALKWVGKL